MIQTPSPYNVLLIMKKHREDSGISLPEIRRDLQEGLIQPYDKEPEHIERRLVFSEGRLVDLKGHTQTVANIVRNQKYSVLTFVPLVLYKQFQYFFNLFYLLTAISQFIPALKVGLLFSFLAPLVLVIFLTMLKEAFEDFQRYKKDKEFNSLEFVNLQRGLRGIIRSEELKVGDIIQVSAGQSVPADCLLLATLNQKPIFIKTDQLDGQTDWKLRKPLVPGQQPLDFILEFNSPVTNVYEFAANLEIVGGDKFGIGLEQTLWRGVKVASGKAILLVIYTGKQTKLSLNCKSSGNKFGILDQELNYFSKILFGILLCLSITLVILRGSYGSVGQSFVLLFKYFLLLCSIIPISMRVNLDFAKLLYKYQIDHDAEMPGCQCRNSNIPEELGRISYVLTDKTGTLTQNQMVFKRLLISEELTFDAEDKEHVRTLIQSQADSHQQIIQKKRLTSACLALALCHNVTPVIDDQKRVLQGSSPDQLTLVSFAEELGFVVAQRSQQEIVLDGPEGEQVFQIMNMFPFTSESKNMGIMVKQGKNYHYYLKGADSVMAAKIGHLDANFMEQACLDLSREGLRTLVVAQKMLTPQMYSKWKEDLNEASTSLKHRQKRIAECRSLLERGMDFVAVTGVEDKLQKGVVETVSSLRTIGVRVWMLTGDKIETAICVGRAVKLIKGQEERLFVLQDAKSRGQFHQKLDSFYREYGLNPQDLPETFNCVLVIDGTSLRWALQETAKQFFQLAIRLPAIICSRVSPTQKAEVALLVREFGEGRVLGIGDGGNDVALIQSAHVGVGIYGKQGIQAALASDFSVSQFKDLNSLIYWHGRLSYKRSSLLSQFIIHRGTIITIMQTIFCIEYFFVPLPIYNGFLLLGYATIFTMLPVFSLVLDQDISRKVALEYPILYKRTQQGTLLTPSTFLYWIFISVYQGAIIMILIEVLLASQSFYMVSTISFTCLVIIQFLNIFTELHRIKTAQVISTILSLIIYLLIIFLMRNVINGIELFSTAYLPSTLAIVLLAWGPPFLYEVIKSWLNPTDEQKLMKNREVKSRSVRTPSFSETEPQHI